MSYAALFLLREPTAGLGAIAALALATAAYPYGKVLWHRLFVETLIDTARPTLGAWLRALVPVLLLLAPPVISHIRGMKSAYTTKETDNAEVAHLTHHLTKNSLILGGTALGTALLLGLLVTVGSRLLASEARFLGRNSALVMLVVALLVVFALGLGTGLFGRSDKAEEGPPDGAQDEAERS